MNYQISDETLKETNCPNNYSCLRKEGNGKKKVCAVREAHELNELVLNIEDWKVCDYCINFGLSQICTCPTHYAVYKKYLSENKHLMNNCRDTGE